MSSFGNKGRSRINFLTKHPNHVHARSLRRLATVPRGRAPSCAFVRAIPLVRAIAHRYDRGDFDRRRVSVLNCELSGTASRPSEPSAGCAVSAGPRIFLLSPRLAPLFSRTASGREKLVAGSSIYRHDNGGFQRDVASPRYFGIV